MHAKTIFISLLLTLTVSGTVLPRGKGNANANGNAVAQANNATVATGAAAGGAAGKATGAGAAKGAAKGAAAGAATGAAATGAAAGGATAAAGGAADFGTCTPTMDFQLGRAGRKADEGTFLPTDPVVAEGQQDALNPNIITNRICDQLTNVCGADQAAVDLCTAAQATVEGLGTKDATTADAFNAALGF